LTIKDGQYAKLADSSAVGNVKLLVFIEFIRLLIQLKWFTKMDETHVLATIVSKESTEKKSFLGLSVKSFSLFQQ
jgi:hypothetical protein